MALKLKLKLRNCQGIRVPGRCISADVFSKTDILEEILVRVPPEFISNSILVSKCWFGLIRSASFCIYYTRRWSHALHLVGFKGFYVRNYHFFRTPISQDGVNSYRRDFYDWVNAHRFLTTTSQEGNQDNDVVVFGQHDYIIDSSSNGILLIGRQSYPFTFIVWNPFTKKHHQLPQPRENYQFGCVAFEVEYHEKGSFHYKVTRAKCDISGGALDTVSLQTFSSKTGGWEEKTLPSSRDMKLNPRKTGTVIRGVIHWPLLNAGVGIYDPIRRADQPLAFISNPDKGTPYMGATMYYVVGGYGESAEGLLQCAHSCGWDMKIWVLEIEQGDYSYSNYRWSLRYKIEFNTLRSKNPSVCEGNYESISFYWMSFVPRSSEYGFLRLDGKIFLMHMPSQKLEQVTYEDEVGSSNQWYYGRCVIPYFKWVCPWPNLVLVQKICNF